MRLVAMYNRDFARQFFNRSVAPYIGKQGFLSLTQAEADYLAIRFEASAAVSLNNDLAWPRWTYDLRSLAMAAERGTSRSASQRIETVANRLMFNEGFMALGGLHTLKDLPPTDNQNLRILSALYMSASKGAFRKGEERQVLRCISFNAPKWVKLLGEAREKECTDILRDPRFKYPHLILPGDD